MSSLLATAIPPVPPRPTTKMPVRVLLEHAELNVEHWAFTKDGDPIENPNNNIGRNTNWAFIGKADEPVVLCIWYRSIDWVMSPSVYQGNEYVHQRALQEMLKRQYGEDGERRLKSKISRSRQLHQAVYEAFRASRTVRLLLVEGDPVPVEESADRASTVSARALDPGKWFVHEFDGVTGNFKLVRGISRPPVLDDDGVDADDWEDEFLEMIGTLDQTTRDALIKARVGQGKFRAALIERWGGKCSVTGLAHEEVLIASHIKPWSLCDSKRDRWSPANGLLLTPNLDKLFDTGLIGFGEDFRMLLSPRLKTFTAAKFGATGNERLRPIGFDDMRPFLRWHREHFNIKS